MGESKGERRVREELSRFIEADENIIAVTRGFMQGGNIALVALFGFYGRAIYNKIFARKMLVGLTDKRILFADTGGEEPYGYALSAIKSVEFSNNAGWLTTTMPGKLRIRTQDSTIDIEVAGKQWKEISDVFAHRVKTAIKK